MGKVRPSFATRSPSDARRRPRLDRTAPRSTPRTRWDRRGAARWFVKTVAEHPYEDGWKVFVFSHARDHRLGAARPAGVPRRQRLLLAQPQRRRCSQALHRASSARPPADQGLVLAHFHLSHDYEDSMSFPAGLNRGDVRLRADGGDDGALDARRPPPVAPPRGNSQGFEICTVDHSKGGEVPPGRAPRSSRTSARWISTTTRWRALTGTARS